MCLTFILRNLSTPRECDLVEGEDIEEPIRSAWPGLGDDGRNESKMSKNNELLISV